MAKRKVKSEVSIRVKQSRKGTRKSEPIVATVRIGQPVRRGGSVAERTAKPVLPAFQGALAAQAALGIRTPDLAITAGFRNLENQQQNIFKGLEEQKQQIMNISKDTSQLMAERAGLRQLTRVGPRAYSDQSSVAEDAPSEGKFSPAPSQFMFDEDTTARKIERLQQAMMAQVSADPRRVPSLASSVLSEPAPEIQEVAGADMEVPTGGGAAAAAAAMGGRVREQTPMDIMAEEERKAEAIRTAPEVINIPQNIQLMRIEDSAKLLGLSVAQTQKLLRQTREQNRSVPTMEEVMAFKERTGKAGRPRKEKTIV